MPLDSWKLAQRFRKHAIDDFSDRLMLPVLTTLTVGRGCLTKAVSGPATWAYYGTLVL